MKMRRPHWVPLAPQCVAILTQQRQISGDGRYVFPNGRSGSDRPMSDGAMGAALKWLCFAHDGVVPHGFRVSASTLLHELGFDRKIIEARLAHEKVDQVAKVYNRAVYVPERCEMMERWCTYIDELKTAANPRSAD
jgi:integrase